MADPIRSWYFAAVVVRDGDRVALVHEPNGTWGVPGGRLEVGETFVEAAQREVREEAGIDVELLGILEVEHTPLSDGSARMGLSFLGRQVGDAALKTDADAESRGARWCSIGDLDELTLRGPRVGRLARAALAGVAPAPLSHLVGMPQG